MVHFLQILYTQKQKTDSIENGEDNNTVDTTLGEAGEKGRLNVMLDALNGLVD